ncbi:MAG: 23S rRNA (pseudouridine(1915)-N(3))-methyltransferase RlmH [Sandaracinaceae bacterium]|nr:23S rRNA (pseudouridine(1915)-N(3))-methyltransferase RlmH [Sandaracinaceae bacterium]MDW8246174.1 23S rRNA (pseudouridine(1915)-N(3))-methyltransferase RlmH [Sandaracinaceae bacterium]
MRLLVIAIGRAKEPELRAMLEEYAKRIRRYARFEEIEIEDGPEEAVARKVKRHWSSWGYRVALEIDGRMMDSRAFAEFMMRLELGAKGAMFLIGGAYGLPRELAEAADLRLSLSPMTFPHRIARLLLYEQIYRAFSMLRGEPYAH